MLINADVFLATVVSYRLVWISGRFGGGKTSLAYRIAQEFLERDYRLVTNNKSVWSDPLESVRLDENNHLKTVVILDEGGLWFKSSKQIEMVKLCRENGLHILITIILAADESGASTRCTTDL